MDLDIYKKKHIYKIGLDLDLQARVEPRFSILKPKIMYQVIHVNYVHVGILLRMKYLLN